MDYWLMNTARHLFYILAAAGVGESWAQISWLARILFKPIQHIGSKPSRLRLRRYIAKSATAKIHYRHF